VEKERVSTWADAFGVWHATVAFPLPGYGPTQLAREWSRIRAKARRAIRSEILARERGPIKPVRLSVVNANPDHMNMCPRVTFKEHQ
jgi:hypothetical protein